MIWYHVAAIMAVATVAYWLGRTLEGSRWAENADKNGARMFHGGRSYKVRKLPEAPGKQDE